MGNLDLTSKESMKIFSELHVKETVRAVRFTQILLGSSRVAAMGGFSPGAG